MADVKVKNLAPCNISLFVPSKVKNGQPTNLTFVSGATHTITVAMWESIAEQAKPLLEDDRLIVKDLPKPKPKKLTAAQKKAKLAEMKAAMEALEAE